MTVEEFSGAHYAISPRGDKWDWVVKFNARIDTLTLHFEHPVSEAFATYAMTCILFADRTDQYYRARPPSKLDDGKTWVFYHRYQPEEETPRG
jgi:hypothetical protein